MIFPAQAPHLPTLPSAFLLIQESMSTAAPARMAYLSQLDQLLMIPDLNIIFYPMLLLLPVETLPGKMTISLLAEHDLELLKVPLLLLVVLAQYLLPLFRGETPQSRLPCQRPSATVFTPATSLLAERLILIPIQLRRTGEILFGCCRGLFPTPLITESLLMLFSYWEIIFVRLELVRYRQIDLLQAIM